jgi:glycosyltransferase involved in cell wall biosynthesis
MSVTETAPAAGKPSSAPAKVVRVIARLNIGGPAIHTVLASVGVDPARFPTLLVAGRPGAEEGDMTDLARERGADLYQIDELGRDLRAFHDVRAFYKLWRLLRRERPLIVHTHTAKAGTLGRLAAILAGVPIRVHTFHGHVFEGYFPPWKTAVFLAIERLLARHTDRILTLSGRQKQDVTERYRVAPADKVDVVPLGLDLAPLAGCEAARGQLRAELRLGPEVPLIAMVGRFVPIKNHALFLQAAAVLGCTQPDARFVLVGDGECARAIAEQTTALGLQGRVIPLGWRRDLQRIYADLNVVALTSLNEGTPVALIEAMAAGVPVVATSVGGVADLLQGGRRGEVIAVPASPEQVADGLLRALSPLARERARRVRAEIVAEYGVERLCRRLEDLYTALALEGEVAKACGT